MTQRSTPTSLTQPRALLLTRIEDRLSFLYLDRCTIHRNDNGIVAMTRGPGTQTHQTQLPVATLTTLMLGPGTSLTQAAAAGLAHAGCGAVFVGEGAVRAYNAFLSPYAPTTRLLRQAELVTHPEQRLEAARRMYLKRFPGVPSSTFAASSIEQMRGVEGIRMRAVYAQHAKAARVPKWRRNTGTEPQLGAPDAVNLALNAANSALYGIVNAVLLGLGLSPGLGVIHTGNRLAFTLDIADLYKTSLTIPLAFSLKDDPDPSNTALRKLRHELHLIRMLPTIVSDLDDVLDLPHDDEPQDWDIDELRLWGTRNEVTANWSHAGWVEP